MVNIDIYTLLWPSPDSLSKEKQTKALLLGRSSRMSRRDLATVNEAQLR